MVKIIFVFHPRYMKRIITRLPLFMLLCLGAATSLAQKIMPGPAFPKNRSNLGMPASKTTATANRLSAVSSYGYQKATGYYFNDSNSFTWSGLMTPTYEAAPIPLYHYENAATNIYTLSSAGAVALNTQTLNTYTGTGLISTTLTLNWNILAGAWDTAARTRNTYSGTGDITESVDELYSGRIWIGRLKTLYTYSSGLLTGIKTQTGSGSSVAWTNSKNTVYMYTGTKMTAQTEQSWYSSGGSAYWKNTVQMVYSYTGDDTTEKIVQQWNTTSSSWENKTRFGYDFTERPYPDEYIDTWNKSTAGWDKYQKNDVVYAVGDLAEYLEQSWDNATGSWITYAQHFYHFSGPYITMYRKETWVGAAWSINFMQYYKYNSDNQILTSNYYNWDGIEYVDVEGDNVQANYYYDPAVAVDEVPAMLHKATLFPNPARGACTHISFTGSADKATDILLTDAMGRVLWRTQDPGFAGDHSVTVPLAELPAGIYLLLLIQKGVPMEARKFSRL